MQTAVKPEYPVHAANLYEQETANLVIAHMRTLQRERGKLAGLCMKLHFKGRGILISLESVLEDRVFMPPNSADEP